MLYFLKRECDLSCVWNIKWNIDEDHYKILFLSYDLSFYNIFLIFIRNLKPHNKKYHCYHIDQWYLFFFTCQQFYKIVIIIWNNRQHLFL